MLRIFKKSIVFLVSGSFSIILAACYAASGDYTYYRKIQIKNNNGDPIPGLKVTSYDNDEQQQIQQSDSNGEISVEIIDDGGVRSYSILIEDIDSTNNLGYFSNQTVLLDTLEYDEVFLNEIE